MSDPVRNVLLIICDDLGYGDVGFLDPACPNTPRLDALAGRAACFSDFHAASAVCSPTRASLITGRCPQRTGIDGVVSAARHRDTGLPRDERTLAELFAAAGHATALVGKWHLGYDLDHHPLRFGYQSFVGYVSGNVDYHSKIDQAGHHDWWHGERQVDEPGYTTHLITDHACRFIEAHADRPFFLHVGYEAPHYPYQTPEHPPLRRAGEVPEDAHGPWGDGETYRRMVREMDAGVGRLLATLDAHCLRDDTLVLFTSDHGATGPGSNGPLRGGKATLLEGGIRVPTLIAGPGVQAGRVDDTAVTMDLFHTMLDAAGIAPPDDRALDGVSLLPRLRGGGELEPRPLCWAFRRWRAAREGDWKLVQPPSADDGEVPWQLYDLAADPGEATDLADQHPERVERLAAAWRRWFAEVRERPSLIDR